MTIFITFNISFGKCCFGKYETIGVVRDKDTDQPIANAKIICFLDNAQWTGAELYDTSYPDYFISNNDGSFTATTFFNTYSGPGLFVSDRCNYRPKKLTIVIIAEGFSSKRIEYKIKKLINADYKINLPTITLTKINLENPTNQ
jgi:hypothetical protein